MNATVGQVRAAAEAMIGWCDGPIAEPQVLGSILAALLLPLPVARLRALCDNADKRGFHSVPVADVLAVLDQAVQRPTFDDLLTDPMEQFDRNSELLPALLSYLQEYEAIDPKALLRSVEEYRNAPPAAFTVRAPVDPASYHAGHVAGQADVRTAVDHALDMVVAGFGAERTDREQQLIDAVAASVRGALGAPADAAQDGPGPAAALDPAVAHALRICRLGPEFCCWDQGPRVGEDATYCVLSPGHDGDHLAHESFGRVTWSQLRAAQPVASGSGPVPEGAGTPEGGTGDWKAEL